MAARRAFLVRTELPRSFSSESKKRRMNGASRSRRDRPVGGFFSSRSA